MTGRLGANREGPKSDSYLVRNWKGPSEWMQKFQADSVFAPGKGKSTWLLHALKPLRSVLNP